MSRISSHLRAFPIGAPSRSVLIAVSAVFFIGISFLSIATSVFANDIISDSTPVSFTVSDTPTGGDCGVLGTWDGVTHTCTVQHDVAYDTPIGIMVRGDGITIDGHGHRIVSSIGGGTGSGFHVVVSGADNVTVRSFVLDRPYAGVFITNGSQYTTITKNESTRGYYPVYVEQGMGTKVMENYFWGFTSAAVFVSTEAFETEVYHNNMISDVMNGIIRADDSNVFSLPLPIGGNYWNLHRETSDGCINDDGDVFCDHSFTVNFFNMIDRFPFTRMNGWLGHLPVLAYASGEEYGDDNIQTGKGHHPNKGVADKDALTFNIVYTDVDNDAPLYVRLWVQDANGVHTFYDMQREEAGATAPASQTDNDYTNGEIYTLSHTFPKGVYTYAFLTKDTSVTGEELSFPGPAQQGTLSFTTGYSSVAFLPGIGGSRLYTNLGTGEMVWEPNDLADVEQIRLDNITNESEDSSIVVSGITDEVLLRLDAWPTSNVYKTFMQFMDEQVVGVGVIKEWKPLAYDWRLGLDTLISRGEKIGTKDGDDIISYETNTAGTEHPYLIEELRTLAENSDSGKVSLVTHSNGGLLAKYILKHLTDIHDPLLENIDTVVLIASPQLGTPEAVATLLHGTTLIGKGMERDTAEALPSAYHLLPSDEYFHTVSTPVMEFSNDINVITQLTDFVGKTIGGWDGYVVLKDIMTGYGGAWAEPTDIDVPNVLNSKLLTYAETTHTSLDQWVPPTNIRIVQVAGWGLDTIRGISYDNCRVLFCPNTLETLDRKLLKTTLGDGTVVLPSAIAMMNDTGVETYYLNLPEYNNLPKIHRNRKHSGILEADNIQKFLSNVIKNIDLLPEYISTTKPTLSMTSKSLHFIMHSPVAMHLYDVDGNHTGIIQNPNASSDIRVYEENIPNSYYEEFGETKYIGANINTPVTLKLTGEGVGTFTLEVEEVQSDTQTGYTVFSNIPVVKGSTGTITISSVSDVGVLTLDNNGDGAPDVYAFTDEMKGVMDYDILKEVVNTISSNQKKTLLTQVVLMETLRNRGAVIAEKALLLVFKKQIAALANQKLPTSICITWGEKTRIDAIVDILIEQLTKPVEKRKSEIQEEIKKLKKRY